MTPTHAGHAKQVCKHGRLVAQCRCPGPKPEVIVDCLRICAQIEDEMPNEDELENALRAVAWQQYKPWRWLSSTYDLQRTVYGYTLPIEDPEELGRYLSWNVTALVAELGEFLAELPQWKPWIVDKQEPDTDARSRALGEAVDLAHFLANILCALNISDDLWEVAYRTKQNVNRDRQASGTYTGTKEKCPGCKRDLAEVGTAYKNPHADVSDVVCNGCGHKLSSERLDRSF